MLIGHLTALFTVIVWGITFISTKILLRDLSPEEILLIRFLLGWLALWAFAPKWLKWQRGPIEGCFAAAGFFGVTLYFLLENIALDYTYASNVGVIVSAAPFFTALTDWLFFNGRKPALHFYCGFILAIAGIAIISFGDANVTLNPVGDLLALLAAVAWAFYSGFTQRLTRLNLGSLVTTRRIFFYGLLFMAPVAYFDGLTAPLSVLWQPHNLLNLLFLGLCASALCFATWTFCLKRLGNMQASAYIYLVPVITVLAASLWLREPISIKMALGMVLVIIGLIISEFRFPPKKARFFPPAASKDSRIVN